MQRNKSRLSIKTVLTILTVTLGCSAALAQGNYQVIHNFDQYSWQPWSGVVLDPRGNLYGNTEQGGHHGAGTVWGLVHNAQGGWNYAILWSFNTTDPGYAPVTTMVRSVRGRVYGTDTQELFEVIPKTSVSWGFSTLHRFTGNADGACNDLCSVSMDAAGDLFGSTPAGGQYGFGVIFKFGPSGFSVLYNFTGANDGGYGVGQLAFDSQGNIYGATVQGGTHGAGVVYRLSPVLPGGNSYTYTVLHSFSDTPDGAQPWGGVMLARDGNLYGTTYNGGTGFGGTAFRLTPNGDGTWSESILHSFNQQGDGFAPAAVPTMDASGNLYGTTICGIEPSCNGTVYKLTPSSNGEWAETIVHAFQGAPNDGWGPIYVPPAIDAQGNVFGTTTQGGPYNNSGVVWEYTP